MRKLTWMLLTSLCVAGCGTPKASFYPIAAKDRKNVATVVVGVDTLTESEWRYWSYAKAGGGSVSKKPADDAFVIKLPQAHSMIVIEVPADDSGRFGPDVFATGGKTYFRYCKGDQVPAVPLKAGEVVYVGDVHLTKDKGLFSLAYGHDFAAAKKVCRARLPRAGGQFARSTFKNFKVTSVCAA